ncbi:LuxR family transcriptional regulator [Nocardioides alcanivorans]|uniref:LuxR family transcriptional regulator n=1 Tax=Nocardioides alcanivorans TaxID=2897352 RepID=UPI001F313A94|nr:LuxR family transcriptional regulator [Nocardioides alcanivorans]
MDRLAPDGRRQLFEETASPLFEEIANRGGVPHDDQLVLEEEESVHLLLEMGLLRDEDDRYVVVDPQSVQTQVVAPLSKRGAELIEESSAWARVFDNLGQAYRRSPSTHSGQISELRGEEIEQFLAAVVPSAQQELLTAQPQTGRDAALLKHAAERDVSAVRRGVTMRTIYQHAARRNRATRAYVAEVTEAGAEVRTLDEFFNRLIVVDRSVAVIPHGENLGTALAIRDTGLIAYLVDIFERSWERGRPFTNRDSDLVKGIAEEQRAMLIRMLSEGHSDVTCAKRLGVSPRTYAGYVADLKREYEVETRFQLGFVLGQEAVRTGVDPKQPPTEGAERNPRK